MTQHCITSQNSFETTTASFVKVASEWGLTVSTEKTKGMVVGHEGLGDAERNSVQVENGSVEVVSHFMYVRTLAQASLERRTSQWS